MPITRFLSLVPSQFMRARCLVAGNQAVRCWFRAQFRLERDESMLAKVATAKPLNQEQLIESRGKANNSMRWRKTNVKRTQKPICIST